MISISNVYIENQYYFKEKIGHFEFDGNNTGNTNVVRVVPFKVGRSQEHPGLAWNISV